MCRISRAAPDCENAFSKASAARTCPAPAEADRIKTLLNMCRELTRIGVVRQDLDRHISLQLHVTGTIDLAMPPLPSKAVISKEPSCCPIWIPMNFLRDYNRANGNGSDQPSVNDEFRMLGTKAPISRH